eukprot:CAMPEP_0176493812 /NCGR_PEP_ID=MMETSP0200_2-20121128/9744_1 /TAXON_ID=947934 /ORGANISM="Chaetoceros sp., Strain GSL56" /LENGTH=256 /DNA_ID=CAMNT_0017891491 /DNA_START=330 /DNA_END=1100 /DNA_ORIENTATION=-
MDSPSAHRNKDPIWSVLQTSVLPLLLLQDEQQEEGRGNESSSNGSPLTVLEVAAGCGVHTTYFTSKLDEESSNVASSVHWIATDPDPPSLESLRERVRDYQAVATTTCSNCAAPDSADVTAKSKCTFQVLPMTLGNDGIVQDDVRQVIHNLQQSLNLMICINMIHISPWSATVGLFQVAKEHLCHGGILMTYGPYKQNGTAVPSNLAFDESLKARNPEWGVRDLEAVQELGSVNGMVLRHTIEMPANNLCLIFQKE